MRGLVEVRHGLVAAVRRHRVLHEVVRSDREEVDVLREVVRDERGGRHLYHRADAHAAVVWNPLAIERGLHLRHGDGAFAELLDAADHRIEHEYLSVRRGAQYRPYLRAENVAVGKQVANRAVAEERIRLLRGDSAHELVAADVEDAYGDAAALRKRRGELRGVAVRGELLLLRGLRPAYEPQVLAAVESDSARALLAYAREGYAWVDVGEDAHLAAGLERSRRRAARDRLVELDLAFDEVAEVAYRRLVGIQRYRAVRSVEEHELAGLDARRYVAESRHRGQRERAGEQRHVARGGAPVRSEAEH